MEIEGLTIKKINKGLREKKFSAKEVCQSFLAEIEKKNKEILAFVTVMKKEALSFAEKIDKLIKENKEIPLLTGIPFAIKDNILVEDVKCSAGSKILENYIASYDATVIEKLKKQGAIILGKTNLDEFAMGSSTEYSAFGPTKNPYDLKRVAGGSSGGSAAAIAANMAVAALGSDTGGSIRLPANFCGVVGLKPTYGAVSRYGLIAMASSLDQIGPITKTVEDCQIVFDIIKGEDKMDSTTLTSKTQAQVNELGRLKDQKLNKLKIGLPREYFIEGIDKRVEKLVKKAIKRYEELGARIKEIFLVHTEYALPCYYIIMPCEVSANLARYDGIRYGKSKIKNSALTSTTDGGQKSKIKNLLDVYLQTRKEYLGSEVKRRIILGTFALSAGYYEAYYLRAQKVRAKIKEDFKKAFQEVDVILTPVSPTPAFKIGEKIKDPLKMYLADIFTVSVNLAGLPAISVPIGKVNHLPVGLQIIANYFEENKLFQIAKILEKNDF